MVKIFKFKGELWKGFEFKGKFYLIEKLSAVLQKEPISV